MTVTDVTKDTDAHTLTITSEYPAPVDRVWQLWNDPRLLERWWGPPTYPATVVDHDLQPGGTVTYYMTSPEGDKYHGWWRITTVNGPTKLEFEDGFGNADGSPNTEMPTTVTKVSLAENDGGTRMIILTEFGTAEAMAKLIEMGMDEGMTLALGQSDALL